MKLFKEKGFTLIELLIVIAILGVLATALLVLINPVEQLARGRDAGRKSTVGQLGTAVAAYYTANNAKYPPEDATWLTTLINAGEVKVAPTNPLGGTWCSNTSNSTNAETQQSGWCYDRTASPVEAIVYARLESSSEKSKCPVTITNPNPIPFWVWSSASARAGLMCQDASTPQLNAETLPNFID